MTKLSFLIKKNWELCLVFIVFTLLSLPRLIDICSGYLNYVGYDIQEFLLWNYTSLKHIVLYKSIFFPYGILQYYRNDNPIFLIFSYVITPLLFTILYFLFRKVFEGRLPAFISTLLLFLFVFATIGLDLFSRYGILIAFSLFYSYLLYSKKVKSKFNKLLIGLALGLVFAFVNDQGLYLILSYIFLYCANEMINKKIKLSIKYIKYFLLDNLSQAIGFLLGVIPLLAYLLLNDAATNYYRYFHDVADIAIVAKTPFIPFIASPANLFTIIILISTLFFLSINNLYLRRKLSLIFYFQIALIFDVLLLEQKSIIRSIDRQIIFVSFILCALLIYELIRLFSKYGIKERVGKLVFSLSLLLIVLASFATFNFGQIRLNDLQKTLATIHRNECYSGNLNSFLLQNSEYVSITSKLKAQPGFNGKVFSFPTGDSVLYTMLGQNPPYHNSIFEGSSRNNQIQTVKYMQDNNIEFATLDTNLEQVQDGVPDYIRQPIVFRYIINNYYPFAKIGSHLLLKKSSGKDFFSSGLLQQTPEYRKYLLSVNLYKIPYSEGLYKYKLFKNDKPLIMVSGSKAMNEILGKTNLNFSDKIIAIIPSVSLPTSLTNYITFYSDSGENSTVFYDTCKKNNTCIIDMANIPFFYKERIIKQLQVDINFKGKLVVFDSKNRDNLW